MTKSLPPIPAENRSTKGPGGDNPASTKTGPDKDKAERTRNLAQQGRQGNIKQNTTHQGNQQDR